MIINNAAVMTAPASCTTVSSQSSSSSCRIPLALQSVFLASNQGDSVHSPPSNNDAWKVFDHNSSSSNNHHSHKGKQGRKFWCSPTKRNAVGSIRELLSTIPLYLPCGSPGKKTTKQRQQEQQNQHTFMSKRRKNSCSSPKKIDHMKENAKNPCTKKKVKTLRCYFWRATNQKQKSFIHELDLF
jgi:hypothetical protein